MNVITYNEFESNHPNTISNLRLSLDFYNYKSFAAIFTLFTILKIKKNLLKYKIFWREPPGFDINKKGYRVSPGTDDKVDSHQYVLNLIVFMKEDLQQPLSRSWFQLLQNSNNIREKSSNNLLSSTHESRPHPLNRSNIII